MKKVYWVYFEDDRTDWNILYEDYYYYHLILTHLQIYHNKITDKK